MIIEVVKFDPMEAFRKTKKLIDNEIRLMYACERVQQEMKIFSKEKQK